MDLNSPESSSLGAFRDKIENSLEKKDSRPSSNDLEKYGKVLHHYCFDDSLRRIWDSLPPTNVPIQFISNHPQLRSIPWEYMLGDAAPGPSPNRSIARIVSTVGKIPAIRLLSREKAKSALRASDPPDQEQVSWSEVQSSMEASFARVQGTVDMRTIAGAGWTETVEAILDFGPDIFHFSGHGEVVISALYPRNERYDDVATVEPGRQSFSGRVFLHNHVSSRSSRALVRSWRGWKRRAT